MDTPITSLPEWITTLGPLEDGSPREIYLERTALSNEILERLREIDPPGMQIYVSRPAAELSMEFNSIKEAFSFWGKILGRE